MTAPNTPTPELEPSGISTKLIKIADASRREDGTDIPLGEQCREAAAAIARLTAERDRYKFNADELRKSWKRQAERYQRTIAEHIERAEAAENRVKELEGENNRIGRLLAEEMNRP